MSHICPCTPCPSPQGYRSKVESRHFAHHCPPACSSPLINEELQGSRPGRYMRMGSSNNTVCAVPQSVWYKKLPHPSVKRPATSQARLHGVLGRKSMYVGQWYFRSPPITFKLFFELFY